MVETLRSVQKYPDSLLEVVDMLFEQTFPNIEFRPGMNGGWEARGPGGIASSTSLKEAVRQATRMSSSF